MPERTGYANGTPSWVDVSTPDLDTTKAFYPALFGWDVMEAGPPEETGGYAMFLQDGKVVAGLGPLTPEQQARGDQPSWTVYLAVDDCDKTVALATQAGATVAVEPMDVMNAGRMAFLVDPTGALVGLWQAGDHIGAQLVNEPNSLCWNEHTSSDPAAALDFYGRAFGLGSMQFPGMDDYNILTVGEDGVGGLMGINEEMAALGIGASWGTVFAVADADAAAARVAELGGSVDSPATDIPVGRVAFVSDPVGARFQVIRLNEQPAG